MYSYKFVKNLGKSRKKNEKIVTKHFEIAGALQRKFEDTVFHLLKVLKKKSNRSNNIVLAGGAAMNCVFNGKISSKNIYKKDYIPSYPDDTGVTIGAALLAYNKFSIKKE